MRTLFDTIKNDPMQRMDLTQAIGQATACGNKLGQQDIAGLMLMINPVTS